MNAEHRWTSLNIAELWTDNSSITAETQMHPLCLVSSAWVSSSNTTMLLSRPKGFPHSSTALPGLPGATWWFHQHMTTRRNTTNEHIWKHENDMNKETSWKLMTAHESFFWCEVIPFAKLFHIHQFVPSPPGVQRLVWPAQGWGSTGVACIASSNYWDLQWSACCDRVGIQSRKKNMKVLRTQRLRSLFIIDKGVKIIVIASITLYAKLLEVRKIFGKIWQIMGKEYGGIWWDMVEYGGIVVQLAEKWIPSRSGGLWGILPRVFRGLRSNGSESWCSYSTTTSPSCGDYLKTNEIGINVSIHCSSFI